MSSFEFQILSYIKEKRAVRWSDLLKLFGKEQQINKVHSFLHKCLDDGLLKMPWKPEKPPECTVMLSPKGHLALQEFQPNKKQKQKLPLKKSNNVTGKFIAALVGIVGFLASLFTVIEFLCG